MQKKVLALHDLSGFGRSSLVPIIAAISAAGHQCVPLPTAYFSTHMAIPGWETVDLTGVMPRVIDQYDRLGLRFESVYAGFLGSGRSDRLRAGMPYCGLKSENGTAFIDPVMGDNGEVYATYTPEMCTRMRELCEIADIITPNTTEAAILLDRDRPPHRRTNGSTGVAACTSQPLRRTVVLTGLDYEPGKVGSGCLSADGGTISLHERIAQYYPGTGEPVCGGRARRAAERQGGLPMPVHLPASSSRTASPTLPRSIPTLCMACNLRSCCRAFFLATRTGLRYNIDRFSDIPR